ncbi:hypothetical protein [Thermoactinomyces sp. DSM 45891]|uniref:hypothetical protein n=1 Tax=Thermoactinomyces sp. DSM 45891 TaxID=1761907 RepID=UPI00093079B7|nr:hypothetical protein [Thermoactinomyces sp. DSM 45891]
MKQLIKTIGPFLEIFLISYFMGFAYGNAVAVMSIIFLCIMSYFIRPFIIPLGWGMAACTVIWASDQFSLIDALLFAGLVGGFRYLLMRFKIWS